MAARPDLAAVRPHLRDARLPRPGLPPGSAAPQESCDLASGRRCPARAILPDQPIRVGLLLNFLVTGATTRSVREVVVPGHMIVVLIARRNNYLSMAWGGRSVEAVKCCRNIFELALNF